MVSDQCDSGNFWFIYGHVKVFHSEEHLIAMCVSGFGVSSAIHILRMRKGHFLEGEQCTDILPWSPSWSPWKKESLLIKSLGDQESVFVSIGRLLCFINHLGQVISSSDVLNRALTMPCSVNKQTIVTFGFYRSLTSVTPLLNKVLYCAYIFVNIHRLHFTK